MIYYFDKQELNFRVSAKDASDDLEVYEVILHPEAPEIMPHFHCHTDEFFYVASGSVDFYADGKRFKLTAGESFLVKRGVAHGFKINGDQDCHMVVSSRNQGRMEKYIAKLETLINDPNAIQADFRELTIHCDQNRIQGEHELGETLRH